ncbi:MAG: glycosyltransferase family A protein [Planctomycetota bacterium]
MPPATETPPDQAEASPTPPAAPAPSAVKPLTWALAIATYKRHDVLMQCVELALAQTRPPAEVVIADASPNWTEGRDRLFARFRDQHPDVKFVFEQARRPSAAVQRNQVAELSESDIVFLFDDDSLMHRGAAEAIMAVYDADPLGQVVGVAARLASQPPGEVIDDQAKQEIEAARVAPTVKSYPAPVRWVRSLLKADDLFVPYDEDFPDHPIPDAVNELHVGRRQLMAGMTMTCRRLPLLEERFEEVLADRGPEDSDVSYRLSRRGAILTALDAEVFHVGSPAGRFSSYSREALGQIGPLVLHRVYSTDQKRSKKRSAALTRRRLMIGLLKDLKQKQWSFPNARASWLALRQIKPIFKMTRDELEAWYPAFQKQLIEATRG